jgi:hypothetical protein
MRSLKIQDGVKDGRQIPKYSRILIFAHICFRFCISSEIFARKISFKAFYTKRFNFIGENRLLFAFLYVNKQNNAKHMGFCYDTLVLA